MSATVSQNLCSSLGGPGSAAHDAHTLTVFGQAVQCPGSSARTPGERMLAETRGPRSTGPAVQSAGAVTMSLLTGARENGGVTVDVLTGDPAVLTSGYVVALPDYSLTLTVAPCEWPTAIYQWVISNSAALSVTGRYAGIWQDSDGNAVLDVVEVIPNREDALVAGYARRQHSIWDVADHCELNTSGDPRAAALGYAEGARLYLSEADAAVEGSKAWSVATGHAARFLSLASRLSELPAR